MFADILKANLSAVGRIIPSSWANQLSLSRADLLHPSPCTPGGKYSSDLASRHPGTRQLADPMAWVPRPPWPSLKFFSPAFALSQNQWTVVWALLCLCLLSKQRGCLPVWPGVVLRTCECNTLYFPEVPPTLSTCVATHDWQSHKENRALPCGQDMFMVFQIISDAHVARTFPLVHMPYPFKNTARERKTLKINNDNLS